MTLKSWPTADQQHDAAGREDEFAVFLLDPATGQPYAASSGIATAATSTLSNVTAAATSTQLLAANTGRKGMIVYNDSTAILYLAYAGSASTTAYSVQMPAQSYFEMPAPVYTGALFGIWSAANGAARITELS